MQRMSLLNRVLFNIKYFRKPPWDTGISPPELIEFIHSHPAGRALDLGCGTGTNAITLAQHGWKVTGVDFAYKAVRTARKKAQQAGLEIDLQVEDVTRLRGIHGTFQLILDIGCFHALTLPGRQAYLQKLDQFLAPGGTYLLYAFFKPEDETARRGITGEDLEQFGQLLTLVKRQDGHDRGDLRSVWLEYSRP